MTDRADIQPTARLRYREGHFGLFFGLYLPNVRPYLEEYVALAKPNFQYEKRQKELAKKKKQEEKRLKKLAAKAAGEPGEATDEAPETDATDTGSAEQK